MELKDRILLAVWPLLDPDDTAQDVARIAEAAAQASQDVLDEIDPVAKDARENEVMLAQIAAAVDLRGSHDMQASTRQAVGIIQHHRALEEEKAKGPKPDETPGSHRVMLNKLLKAADVPPSVGYSESMKRAMENIETWRGQPRKWMDLGVYRTMLIDLSNAVDLPGSPTHREVVDKAIEIISKAGGSQ